MKEIAPGVLLETAFAPYNLLLIKTEDAAVVVDVPPNPLDAMNWLKQINTQTDHIDYLVLTDASLERQMSAMLWNTPIIASEETYQAMSVYDEDKSRRDLSQRFLDLYPEGGQFIDQLKPRKPMLAFNRSFTLHTRTPPLQFEIVDGVTLGSLWVLLPDLGILIAGDTVSVDDVPCFDYMLDSKTWLTTLATLSRRHSIKWIVTGRGSAPVHRGDIEQQREFLRVMRRTARKIARGNTRSGNINEIARDLGQVFFNNRGQRAVKQIKRGLEKLVEEIHNEQEVLQVPDAPVD